MSVVNAADFGVVCDGITNNDNALAVALDYIKLHGGELSFPPGDCVYTTGLVFDAPYAGITIKGSGPYTADYRGTRLNYQGSGVALTRGAVSFVNLDNFTLQGTSSAIGGILDGMVGSQGDNNIASNLQIEGFTKPGAYGVKIFAAIRNYWLNVDIHDNYNGMVIDGANAQNTEVHTTTCRNNGNVGLYIHNGYGFTFYNCNYEWNTKQGILISGKGPVSNNQSVEQIVFDTPWVEGNNAGNTSEIFITADGGGPSFADTKNVTFRNTFFNSGTPAYYVLYVSSSLNFGLIQPQFVSWSNVTVDVNAVGSYAITNDLASTAGGGYMKLFSPGYPAQALSPSNSSTPYAGMHLATYVSSADAPVNITNFSGFSPGIKITVYITEAYTTIKNGATIITTTGGDLVGAGQIYNFYYDGASAAWRQF